MGAGEPSAGAESETCAIGQDRSCRDLWRASKRSPCGNQITRSPRQRAYCPLLPISCQYIDSLSGAQGPKYMINPACAASAGHSCLVSAQDIRRLLHLRCLKALMPTRSSLNPSLLPTSVVLHWVSSGTREPGESGESGGGAVFAINPGTMEKGMQDGLPRFNRVELHGGGGKTRACSRFHIARGPRFQPQGWDNLLPPPCGTGYRRIFLISTANAILATTRGLKHGLDQNHCQGTEFGFVNLC